MERRLINQRIGKDSMNETNYPGIDYSRPGSKTNRDGETDIRYGIIPQGCLMADAVDDISTRGKDLGYESAEQELRDKLRHLLKDYYNDNKLPHLNTSALDDAIDDTLDAIENWAENLEFNGPWRMDEDGVVTQLAEDGDVWVFKSPFYTYAQFCSPCAPGACHLSHPLKVNVRADIASITEGVEGQNETFVSSNKCYCLPADWFEDGKAPYRMWRADNNEEVVNAS